MTKKEKRSLLTEVNRILFTRYGSCPCPLNHDGPFQLLVAVELSAQCTDARVNIITRELFKKYPDIESLARAPLKDVENIIRTGGLFRNKAKKYYQRRSSPER